MKEKGLVIWDTEDEKQHKQDSFRFLSRHNWSSDESIKSKRESDPVEEIDLTGKYFFLSNCTDSPIIFNGIMYQSTEAAYQSIKTKSIKIKYQLSQVDDVSEAYCIGRNLIPFYGWKRKRLSSMRDIVKLKFDTYPNAKEKLMLTYPKKIVARNNWGDTYWGIYNNKGNNFLGKILMNIRRKYIYEKELEEFWESDTSL